MQEMIAVADLYRSNLAEGNELILDALRRFSKRGLRRVYPAWGVAAAPAAATVSQSTRLILGIDGRNQMEMPQGKKTITKTLQPGDLCFIDRQSWNNPLHTYKKCFLCIDFKLDRIRYYLRRTPGPGSTPAKACLSWVYRAPDPCTRHVVAACEHLLANEQQQALLHQLTTALITHSVHELENPVAQSSETQTWLHICDWIDEHLHEEIDRHTVAVARGVHPNHVSRLFRRHADQRFVDYISEQRIERAKHLLQGGGLRIVEIARRCGFSSAEYFSTVFKRHAGCSPGRWLKG